MKIRDLNKTTLEHIQKQNRTGKIKSGNAKSVSGNNSTSGVDHVSISEKSREIQKLKSVIASTPDVRKEKVEELKEKIEKGEYKVSPRELAKRILQET